MPAMQAPRLDQYMGYMPWDTSAPQAEKGSYPIYTKFEDWIKDFPSLLYEQGDRTGMFGDAYTTWKQKADADKAAWESSAMYQGQEVTGPGPEWNAGFSMPLPFAVTPQQLQQYFDSGMINVGKFKRALVTDPTTGQQYIRGFTPEQDVGFGDQIAGMIGPALAGAALGVGGADIFGQFGGLGNLGSGISTSDYGALFGEGAGGGSGGIGAGSGLGDASWGVNQIGGNVDLGDWLNLGDIGNMGGSGGFDLGDWLNLDDISGMRDLSSGPAGTNLQDLITRLDKLPPGTSTIARTALGKILAGNASPGDWASALGALGSTALGVVGANQQQNALSGLANQYMQMGAPYRAMLGQSYSDPAAFLQNDPSIQASVNQGTSALSRALSAQGGNPAASGRPLQEMQNYATQQLYGQLGNERNRLANFGGLSNFNAAAPQTQMAGIQSQGNVYNALGYGLGQLTQPQNSLADLWKAFGLPGVP